LTKVSVSGEETTSVQLGKQREGKEKKKIKKNKEKSGKRRRQEE